MHRLLILFVLLIQLNVDAHAPHKFYVSICTMTLDIEEQELQLTWQMTTHDVEHVVQDARNEKLRLGDDREHPEADRILEELLREHLQIHVNGMDVNVEYLGKEVEFEETFCYLRIKQVAEIESLEVKNTLMFELSDEQQNIMHLETAEGTKTLVCTPNNPSVTFQR